MGKQMLLMLAVVVLLVAGGCATVVHGGKQIVPITSNPTGAIVTESTAYQQLKTPGSFTLKRNKIIILTAKLDGYEEMSITLTPKTSGMDGKFVGNMLTFPIIGSVVDRVSGAAYTLYPRRVFFNFKGGSKTGNCGCIKDYMSSYGKFVKGEHYHYIKHQYHYVVKLNKANRVVFGKDLFSSCFEVVE